MQRAASLYLIHDKKGVLYDSLSNGATAYLLQVPKQGFAFQGTASPREALAWSRAELNAHPDFTSTPPHAWEVYLLYLPLWWVPGHLRPGCLCLCC